MKVVHIGLFCNKSELQDVLDVATEREFMPVASRVLFLADVQACNLLDEYKQYQDTHLEEQRDLNEHVDMPEEFNKQLEALAANLVCSCFMLKENLKLDMSLTILPNGEVAIDSHMTGDALHEILRDITLIDVDLDKPVDEQEAA